jgi:(4S)-4-hydroxy-5-phosphonooxypentane-2,3-dione isomerase
MSRQTECLRNAWPTSTQQGRTNVLNLDRRNFVQGTAISAMLATVATASSAQAAAGSFFVIAELVAKPGSDGQLRELLTALAEKSRSSEPGCKSYTLLEVGTEPGRFFTYEIWVDKAALDGHMETSHVKDAISKLGPIIAKPPVLTFLKSVSAA